MSRKRKEFPLYENIEITDVAAEGNAIARVNDMVVFVPFGAPGDVVDIKIDKKKKNYAEAVAEKFFAEQVTTLNFQQVKEHMKLIDKKYMSISVYLGKKILDDESGEVIDGNELWEEYKALLQNNSIGYAEKKIRLSAVMARMNCFIYQIKQPEIEVSYDEQIGELFYIRDGEKYFLNGRLNRSMIQGQLGDGIDFI